MTSCNPVAVTARTISRVSADPSLRQDVHACLENLLEQARRHQAALVLAAQAGDETVGVTAAGRLRRTLFRAVRLVHAAATDDPATHADRLSRFDEATQGMCKLLQRATLNPGARARLGHPLWGRASIRPPEVRDGRSHVFDLNASGRDLQEAEFCGLHVSHSHFITDMRRSRFSDSLVEASDFTYADLRGTLWKRTRVRNCYLREASFMDAAFDDTMFIDCDLRGANFGLEGPELSTTPGAAFIRCDLREASWGGRDFSGFELVDCQVFDPDDDRGDVRSPDQVAEPRPAGVPPDLAATREVRR